MSRYMAFFPICPVCLEQHVFVADNGEDLDLFECDNVRCKGWRGRDPIFPGDDGDWNDDDVPIVPVEPEGVSA